MSALRHRVATELRAEILAGDWQVGERLPSEPELARRRGVSRQTIRAAMTILEQQGYVARRRGSGTYVTAPQASNGGARDAMSVTTLDLSSDWGAELRAGTPSEGVAPAEVAGALGMEAGAPVGELRHITIRGARRVADATSWWPLEYLALSDVDRSITASLASRGFSVDHSVVRLTPQNADGHIAQRLEVPRGTLVLTVDEIARTAAGVSVLVTRAHHVADAFEFTFLRRTSGQRELIGLLAA